jgi:hypothetical protein
MRLQAPILGDGRARHSVWDHDLASALPVERPVRAEIREEAGAAYLLRLNFVGECLADTWHEDLGAAKAQAEFEYGITDSEWPQV